MLKKSGDTLIQVEPERYYKRSYDSRARFASYWHQIDDILSLGDQSILEIGVGNGFVNQYLRRMGRQVLTIDIDLSLAPNIVGSVSRLPFLDNSFAVINVCEVLEHLPYSDFVNALEEINRVTRQYVVLSIPDRNQAVCLSIRIPRFGWKKLIISFPRIPVPKKPFVVGAHHWEIGIKGFPLSMVKQDIEQAGFRIIRTYRVFEKPDHRFFVLQKKP